MDFVFALVERRVFGLDVDLDFSYMTYHRATFFFRYFVTFSARNTYKK